MRRTHFFTKTLKQAPADEVARNAQLLIRAGFIHKEMAGVYAYLPLGLRVIEKIKQIVREEMNRAGSEELLMTTLQPSDVWEKSNRWSDEVVDNWFKTRLLNGTELGVGLTHEEPIVDAAKNYISSYKDLPRSVYQIGNKFRNEKRAKSGLLRGREFIMKDAYTFARDQAQHEHVYEEQATAYGRVYDRLGIGDITYRVKADGGIFTPRYSDEFQTRSEIGEDTIYHVPNSTIYFNQEVAPSQAPETPQPTEQLPMEERFTPGVVGVEQLARELDVPVARTVKTMLYVIDGVVTAVAVRGDYSINEVKLRMTLGATSVVLADEATIRSVTGAEVGYAGLLGLADEIRVVIDDSVEPLVNFELGANKTDYHVVNVNWERDIARPEKYYDVKEAKEGDMYPESGEVYEVFRAVEVGNIFPLETKYTDALDMYYTDEHGERQSLIMGCYGIGVSRLMGVIAEHFSDERGLVWPEAIAPYDVYLISIGDGGAARADSLYDELTARGVEVLYDDREARPGEKFADAELMGIPWRVTASDRLGEMYELTERKTGEVRTLTGTELLAKLK
ncbi:proline--tRNA ligase [Candidatus Saccharibacteria bacterium]|nr:MAG: proline--tRNA ligase [Candidatus Saccharibacteria bacterium]